MRKRMPMIACLALLAGGCAMANEEGIVLRGAHVSVSFDDANGTIKRIEDGGSGIALLPPAGTAGSYRLTLMRQDKTTLSILGRDQKLSSVEQASDKVVLHWDAPLHDAAGGEHNIAVRMVVTTDGDDLQFTLHLENHTEYKVREAMYPDVGGLAQLHAAGKAVDATLWVPTSSPWEKPLASWQGDATFEYPGQACMSFVALHSPSANRSLYFASQDSVARYKVYSFSAQTGVDGTKDVSVCIQHFPFTPPDGVFDGSPITLRFVDGNWRACGQVYRKWFISTFGIAQPADSWIRQQSFFLMTMFMLPEGTINYTYKDIPKWAKAAKEHGINAVQVSGWQMGGHDNGYPHYVPDPRLGTWEELEAAIKECHKMGVKVFFFVNYQHATLETEWYKKELYKYREMSEDGGYTYVMGWGMGTLWARMGHSWLMILTDLSFPRIRQIIVDQFARLAQAGADGVHVDKMVVSPIDYNPDIPLSPDTATLEGSMMITKEVMAACRKYNPDWAMSFECIWDRMLPFTGATWWVSYQDITRQVFPENAQTVGLYNGCDYLGVNNDVRDGHVVMVAPQHFTRGVEWPPFHDLADYIKEVKRIRDDLQETVFYGEVCGHDGVTVGGGDDRGIEYNVFRNRENGRRVCAITNSCMAKGVMTVTGFDAGLKNARVHTPFQKPRVVALPAAIEIPGERIVFVEETDAPPTEKPTPHIPASNMTPDNGDFQSGDSSGWTADPNWVVVDNSCGYYAGWRGKYWAWSGGKGEPATGALKSKPFVLDNDAVHLMIAGWDSIQGSGTPRRWNYVTLNLEDGAEIDRVYAPNTTTFVPAVLDGSGARGKRVYVEAVDDADAGTFSMLCIDDVHTAALPADVTRPIPKLPRYDSRKSIRIENDDCLVEVSRGNGSLTRIHDKKGNLDLILEPRLAGSYRFGLVIPGKETWQRIDANWVRGCEQKLSSCKIEGDRLTLIWNGPQRNYLGDPCDVTVTETIELGHGGVLFNMSIDNRTPYAVGEVYFPVVGGIRGLGSTRGQLKETGFVRSAAPSGSLTTDIFRVFTDMSGFGDEGPEQYYAYPEAQPEPWFGLANVGIGKSVYIGAHDPKDRKLVVRLELVPTISGTVREDGNWPRVDELKGIPVGVECEFVDIANLPAGQTYSAAPVFIKFVDGVSRDLRSIHTTWKSGR